MGDVQSNQPFNNPFLAFEENNTFIDASNVKNGDDSAIEVNVNKKGRVKKSALEALYNEHIQGKASEDGDFSAAKLSKYKLEDLETFQKTIENLEKAIKNQGAFKSWFGFKKRSDKYQEIQKNLLSEIDKIKSNVSKAIKVMTPIDQDLSAQTSELKANTAAGANFVKSMSLRGTRSRTVSSDAIKGLSRVPDNARSKEVGDTPSNTSPLKASDTADLLSSPTKEEEVTDEASFKKKLKELEGHLKLAKKAVKIDKKLIDKEYTREDAIDVDETVSSLKYEIEELKADFENDFIYTRLVDIQSDLEEGADIKEATKEINDILKLYKKYDLTPDKVTMELIGELTKGSGGLDGVGVEIPNIKVEVSASVIKDLEKRLNAASLETSLRMGELDFLKDSLESFKSETAEIVDKNAGDASRSSEIPIAEGEAKVPNDDSAVVQTEDTKLGVAESSENFPELADVEDEFEVNPSRLENKDYIDEFIESASKKREVDSEALGVAAGAVDMAKGAGSIAEGKEEVDGADDGYFAPSSQDSVGSEIGVPGMAVGALGDVDGDDARRVNDIKHDIVNLLAESYEDDEGKRAILAKLVDLNTNDDENLAAAFKLHIGDRYKVINDNPKQNELMRDLLQLSGNIIPQEIVALKKAGDNGDLLHLYKKVTDEVMGDQDWTYIEEKAAKLSAPPGDSTKSIASDDLPPDVAEIVSLSSSDTETEVASGGVEEATAEEVNATAAVEEAGASSEPKTLRDLVDKAEGGADVSQTLTLMDEATAKKLVFEAKKLKEEANLFYDYMEVDAKTLGIKDDDFSEKNTQALAQLCTEYAKRLNDKGMSLDPLFEGTDIQVDREALEGLIKTKKFDEVNKLFYEDLKVSNYSYLADQMGNTYSDGELAHPTFLPKLIEAFKVDKKLVIKGFVKEIYEDYESDKKFNTMPPPSENDIPYSSATERIAFVLRDLVKSEAYDVLKAFIEEIKTGPMKLDLSTFSADKIKDEEWIRNGELEMIEMIKAKQK
jgi:hypothetical protein